MKAGSNPFGKHVVTGTVVNKESVASVKQDAPVLDNDGDDLPF